MNSLKKNTEGEVGFEVGESNSKCAWFGLPIVCLSRDLIHYPFMFFPHPIVQIDTVLLERIWGRRVGNGGREVYSTLVT